MTRKPRVSRHSAIRAGLACGLGAGLAGAAGCGGDPPEPGPRPAGTRRIRYDDGAGRFGELSLPKGDPVATAVLLHGGYWQSSYGLDLMRPMARDLVGRGWAVWNLEYRRVGAGGGWPMTMTDTAAGVDHVAELDGVTPDRVVLLGHSAGGQLAVWAASRTRSTPGGTPRVEPRGVVSLAGVLDLRLGSREGLGGGAVDQLLGGSPDDVPRRYELADPARLAPASCPVALLRGRSDEIVPLDQATSYRAAAREAGGSVSLRQVDGDHFTIIDPTDPSWGAVHGALDRLRGPGR